MTAPLVLLFLCLLLALGVVQVRSVQLAKGLAADKRRRALMFWGFLAFASSVATSWLYNSIYLISKDELGVCSKILSSSYLAVENNVAAEGEAGWQAQVMTPGPHFRPWPIYEVERFEPTEVPQGYIGIVESLGGRFPSEQGAEIDTEGEDTAENEVTNSGVIRSPTKWEQGDSSWTDAAIFLRSPEGFRGLQNPPLSPGMYRLNPKLFRVIQVNTNEESVRLGKGNSELPGIDSPVQTNASGVDVSINAWISFKITEAEAYRALQVLGTKDVNARAKEKVMAEARIRIRYELRNTTLADLDSKTQDVADRIRDSINNFFVDTYGITIVAIGFTSIFDPTGEGGPISELRRIQADEQMLKSKIEQNKLMREEIVARGETEQAEQKLFEDRLGSRINAITKVSSDEDLAFSRNAAVLLELFSESNAFKILAIREAASAGIPITPQVIMGSQEQASLDLGPIIQDEP